jgi:hypothetical protein
VFENRVLRRIFGPKRDEVTGEWRKLHNDELRKLHSSQSIIRKKEARLVERMENKRNAYRLLVGKPEGKRQLRSSTWKYNFKMGLTQIGWNSMDWINLAQDKDKFRALVNTVMKNRAE